MYEKIAMDININNQTINILFFSKIAYIIDKRVLYVLAL